MLTFIKTNGVYLGFWILMAVVAEFGMYWAVRLALIDALTILNK